jgi:creatinine amidohydrolase
LKKVMLTDMSWYEFRDAMSSNDLVIIPVGSVEEHGQHNPLGADLIIARAAANAIGERVNAPVAPVMPIGNARNLMGFPGTASIDPELLRQVMVQVCEAYIMHGAKRFLFINGHGGNTAALKMVAADLYAKHGAIATQTEWWTILKQISEYPCNDHGGYYETSMVMAVDENLVDMSKAKTVPRKNLTSELIFKNGLEFRGVGVPVPVTLDKLTPVGNYGAEAEKANVEMGRKMFEVYVDYCAGLAEELRKIVL